ncbi:hypothetical protein [Echinicola sp. 20G]|uniref:hypothetical protein n=1 Tax=Echinicola sp. 20G TaxID=2781961 RepID=UPI00190FEF27|nr:hypothetical protein [Echinicola sp. 20G]
MRAIINIFCCSVCFLIFSGELFAQRGDGSLYSSYGIGLLSEDNFGQSARLGGVGTAVRSPYFLNQLNPASATSVSAYNFMVDAQVDYRLMNIKTSSEEITINRTNLSLVSFWFRTGRKSAMTLGIMPMSSVDYSFAEKTYFEGSTTPFDKYISGYGDINKIYMNFALDVLPRVTLGVRPYYAFGNINHETYYNTDLVTEGTVESFKMNERDNYNGVGADVGIQFVPYKKEGKQLTIGASYQLPSTLKSTTTSLAYLNDSDSVLYEIPEKNDNVLLGSAIKGGISFQNKNLLIAVDYSHKIFPSEWEDYTNSQRFSLGGEYMPNFYGFKFLERMNFSAGLFYDTGYILSEGSPVESKGGSIGFGFPIQGFTRINLAYQYEQKGTVAQLSREVTHGITLNFNLADIWFQKSGYQ